MAQTKTKTAQEAVGAQSAAPHMSSMTLMRRFWPYEAKYWKIMVFDLVCAALTCICDMVLPQILRYVTNAATTDITLLI